MRRLHLPLLGLIFALLLVAGCSDDEDVPVGDGKFSVEFLDDSIHTDVEDRLIAEGTFVDIAELLNARLALPEDVTIVVGDDVGADGPAYDPETREILMPVPFVVEARQLLASEFGLSPAEAQNLALDGNLHALLHEIGHALVDVLELPITGAEEDAVDQLATVLAVNEDEPEIALSGADLFLAESTDPAELSEIDFWGEHDLDQKRFTAIVCLVVGSDPERFADVAREYGVPDDQLDVCVEEWDTANRSWERLLEDHLR